MLDFQVRERVGSAFSVLLYLVFLPLYLLTQASDLSSFGALREDRRGGRKRSYLIETAVSWMLVPLGLGKLLKLALFLLVLGVLQRLLLITGSL